MKLQRNILLAIVLLTCGMTFAQEKEQNLDSLKAVMSQEDYILSSLLVASAGNDAYNSVGHAALRLQCPSKGVDNTFEFATLITRNITAEVLKGSAKGAFVRLRTSKYIERYREESRKVVELPLNFNPQQELKMWEFLDSECDKGREWHFNYESNCSNMLSWAVESCLLGEQIKYNNVDPILLGTYREVFAGINESAPWSALFWNIIMGPYGDTPSEFKFHLYPKYILSEWQKASLIDTQGNERPMSAGKTVTLYAPDKENGPHAITPLMVILFLLAWSAVVTIIERRRGYTVLGRITDIILFTIQMTVGALVTGLILVSTQPSTDWNWLIVCFNPLPLILWLIFRRKPVMPRIWLMFTIVLVINGCLAPFQPQLIHTHLYLLMLAFAIRTAWMSQLTKR